MPPSIHAGGRRRPPQLPSGKEASRDWGSLPPDFLVLLSEKLSGSVDYVRLRSVCSLWRSVVRRVKFPPLLMLPPRKDSLQFYDLAHGEVHAVPLGVDVSERGFLGSSRGWVFLTDVFGSISALNPFTGAQFNLPPATWDLAHASGIHLHRNIDDRTWFFISDADWLEDDRQDEIPIRPSRMRLFFVSEIVLMPSPADDGHGGCLAVAVLASSGSLAFCRIGDKRWRLRRTGLNTVAAIASRGGERLCAMDEAEEMAAVLRADHERGALDLLFSVRLPPGYDHCRICMPSEHELLMIGESCSHESDDTQEYEIYRCNLEERLGEWSRVESLGEAAMFATTHFKSSTFMGEFHGCRGNTVWFSDPDFGLHGEKSGWIDGQRRDQCIELVDLGDGTSQEVSCNTQVQNYIDVSWFTPSLC